MSTVQASAFDHHSGYGNVQKGEAQPARFNDAFWGFLFFVQLGVMMACGIVYIPQLEDDIRNSQETYYGYNYQNVNEENGNRMLMSDSAGVDGSIEAEDASLTIASRMMRATGWTYLKVSNAWNGIDADADGRILEEYYSPYSNVDPNALLILIILTAVLGIIFSTLSLGLMIKFAEPLIKISVLMNVFLGGVIILAGVMKGLPELLVLGAVILLISACFAKFVWSRIPFAAINLVTAATAIQANIGVTFFAWTSVFTGGIWMVFWGFASYSTVYILGNCDLSGQCQNDINGIIVFLLTLSLYWTQQVIKNVVHVTVAGTVGTWWWAPFEADSCCSEGVRSSHSRALTYSFGSICFGSLIVAIVQAIKSIIEQARESGDGALICIADCIMGCLETILEIFNEWAFVYVGLYGYTFMEAARNVMTLFKVRGWTAIITDYVVDRVLGLVSILVGVVVGCFAALISYAFGLDFEEPAFFLGLVIGYIFTIVILSVVGSAVNTIIVCYAEDPASFDTNHFELANRMRDGWRAAFPDDFKY